MVKTVVITGAGSGFVALAARALAQAGHTVYAAMRNTTGRNAGRVADARAYAAEHQVELRTVELDLLSQESADAAINTVVAEAGSLDVIIHNAGHMVTGPCRGVHARRAGRVLRHECARHPGPLRLRFPNVTTAAAVLPVLVVAVAAREAAARIVPVRSVSEEALRLLVPLPATAGMFSVRGNSFSPPYVAALRAL